MQRKTLATLHQIVIGAVMAIFFVMAIEGLQRHGKWTLELVNDDGSFTVSLREGRDYLKARGRGRINYQENGPEWLEAGARLKISERMDGVERSLVVLPGSHGSPQYDFKIASRSEEFDAEAADWLAGVMKRLYRQVGLDAERRAQRMARQDGVDAVLDEVAWIGDESLSAIYLDAAWSAVEDETDLGPVRDDLLSAEALSAEALSEQALSEQANLAEALSEQANLAEAQDRSRSAFTEQDRKILEAAAEHLKSDYSLGRWLARVPDRVLQDSQGRDAWSAVVANVDGDHELLTTLRTLLEERSELFAADSSELLNIVVDLGCRQLASDYETHRLALLVAETLSNNSSTSFPEALPRLLGQIGSDYSLRRSLEAFLDPLPSLARQETVLSAGHELESDHEVIQLLRFLSDRRAPSSALPAAVSPLLSSVTSDQIFDVAARLAETTAPDHLPQLIRSLPDGGDHAAARFLIRLVDQHGAAVVDEPAFLKRLDLINSEFELERVREAISGVTPDSATDSEAPTAI